MHLDSSNNDKFKSYGLPSHSGLLNLTGSALSCSHSVMVLHCSIYRPQSKPEHRKENLQVTIRRVKEDGSLFSIELIIIYLNYYVNDNLKSKLKFNHSAPLSYHELRL